MLPNPEIREVTIQDYLKIIKKRLGIILAFLFIIPTIATVFVYTRKPLYCATASIIIESRRLKVTKFEEIYQPQEDQQYMQTQYDILGSRILAEKTFDALRLSTDIDFRNIADPVGKLRSQISIKPVRDSQLVLINVEDTDALRASSIANAFAKVYIEQDVEVRNRTIKEAIAQLESQMSDVKNKLRESEEALGAYLQNNRIVTIPDVEERTETLLGSLKQHRSRLETDLAESLKRYKEKHPKAIALNAQLEDLNKKIEEETNNFLDLNQKMVQYRLLKKEVESNQELYTSMLTRSKETGVTEKIETSPIRIVDTAEPPAAPFKPQKRKTILTSIMFSLFCGVAFSLFLEYLDSSIRTAEDVSNYINLPFLGYIPSGDKEAKTDIEKNLICLKKPQSIISEAYRAIRTSILFASPEDKPLKVILITSSLPAEGKTFFSTNLSFIFSQINERIIFVDTDMRRPKMHKSFNLDPKPGLSNFLTGNVELAEIIKATSVSNLSIITSGTIPPNPSELLSSVKLRALFEDLRSRYDRIILDSPPILSVTDTFLLANLVDGVILVVKGVSTRLEAVIRAKQKIIEAKGKIIGVVVNNIEPEKEDSYYYYHYYGREGKK